MSPFKQILLGTVCGLFLGTAIALGLYIHETTPRDIPAPSKTYAQGYINGDFIRLELIKDSETYAQGDFNGKFIKLQIVKE